MYKKVRILVLCIAQRKIPPRPTLFVGGGIRGRRFFNALLSPTLSSIESMEEREYSFLSCRQSDFYKYLDKSLCH
jgi:hypothetical protein